jgi:uncharacterized protein GlcG (DUF336 family)
MRLAIGLAVTLAAAGARADDLPRQPVLTAALASEAVQAAVEACAKQGKHVTAAVVDQGGNLRALLRDDGATPHTVDSATKKAYTANTYRTATLEFSRRVAANPDLADLRRMNDRVLILGGGVPIKVGEEVIGAIGAGGTPSLTVDEGCAKAGLERIQDRLR